MYSKALALFLVVLVPSLVLAHPHHSTTLLANLFPAVVVCFFFFCFRENLSTLSLYSSFFRGGPELLHLRERLSASS